MNAPAPGPIPKRCVYLVDDHPLVREWLTNLINRQEDLHVSGDSGSAPEALEAIQLAKPDVAVVDITLSNGSGIDLIKDLQRLCPDVKILVLSMHDESLYAERAFRAGARGYVMKGDTTKKIITALRDVLDGKLFASEDFKDSITEKHLRKGAATSPMEQLSDRELEVFQMLGRGIETRRIAETLNISMKTVQVYCARIKEKLNIGNATELLREAVRWWEAEGKP